MEIILKELWKNNSFKYIKLNEIIKKIRKILQV